MGAHKQAYKRWLKGKNRYVTSFELLQYPDAKIVLLKSFPCDTKDELRAEEQKFIEEFKDICVNKYKSFTGMTRQEYRKEYEKTSRRKAYKKEYEKTPQRKAFLQAYINSEEHKIHKKEYDKTRRAYKSQKFHCIYCNSETRLSDKSRHEKSKNHQANLDLFQETKALFEN